MEIILDPSLSQSNWEILSLSLIYKFDLENWLFFRGATRSLSLSARARALV